MTGEEESARASAEHPDTPTDPSISSAPTDPSVSSALTPPIFRAPPPPRHPVVEAPSSDVAPANPDATLPGVHRGGFSRLPTGPVGVAAPVTPSEDPVPRLEWAPPAPVSRGLSGWALVFAVAGLAFSLFVGWGFPIGVIAVVVGIVALRRPLESRGMAVWAICLGALSVLYSAGWLVWAVSRLTLLG